MKLILLDQDKSYQKRFLEEVTQQIQRKIEVICVFTIEELIKVYDSNSFLLVNEDFIISLIESDWFNTILSVGEPLDHRFLVLSEGIIEPKYIHILQMYCEQIQKEEIDIESFFILKYQRLDQLIYQVTDYYLFQDKRSRLCEKKNSELISVYTPMCSQLENKSALEMICQSANKLVRQSHYPNPQLKALVIDYNCYHLSEEQYSLSYLFLGIKRKQENLSFVLQNIIQREGDVDVLKAPIHMKDIDCLKQDQMDRYLQFLKNETKYDYIFMNFANVHLSQHIEYLLKLSKNCYYNHENKEFYNRIQEQYPYLWKQIGNQLVNGTMKHIGLDVVHQKSELGRS